MKKRLAILLALFVSLFTEAQTITYDTIIGTTTTLPTVGGWNAKVTRHVDHWNRDSVQGIIFSPGAGEDGTNVALLAEHGPHWIIANTGWDGSVVLGNGVHYPVIISLQQPNSSTTTPLNKAHFQAILNKFKIRKNGIRGPGLPDLHLTGISQGGFYSTKFIMYRDNPTDESYARMINSMWLVQGVDAKSTTWGSQPLPWPRMWGYWAKNFRGRIAYMGQWDDYRRQKEYVGSMNDSMPGSGVIVTTSYGAGNHCCYDETYYPTRIWTPSTPDVDDISWENTAGTETTPATSIACSWAQWLLRNGDTTLVGVGNAPPVVSPGGYSALTLPANSVNLNGTATDPDGTIVSYHWEVLSGPSSYTFSNANIRNPVFSNLIAGSYVLKFTATDDDGASTSAQISLLVNPEPGNTSPVVSAGGDKSITLPTSSVTLIGSASDPDGTIVSLVWTKTSGGSATIESPTNSTTVVSGLSQGSYVFRLTVEDNEGSVSIDEAIVSVSGATGSNRTINIAFVKVAGFYKNPAWNNFFVDGNVLSGITSQMFNYSDGASSSVSLSMNRQIATNDNTVPYSTGFTGIPDSTIRYVSTHSSGRNVTMDGFDNSKKYVISVVGTRNSVGFGSIYTINGEQITITTSSNKSNLATFNNVTPTNGQIILNIANASGSSYNHINAIIITEISSAGGNQLPVADAGENQTIKLPTSTVNLTASGSTDPDGTIEAYEWILVSGPNVPTIVNDDQVSTAVTGLVRGNYVFQVEVTDDLLGKSVNTVSVRVNSAFNEVPEVYAGNDTTVSVTSFSLNGDALDYDGNIVQHIWSYLSGPSGSVIQSPDQYTTVLTGLVPGTYKYVLTVTDDSAAVVKDTIQITVLEPPIINCLANAGVNQVITRGTGAVTLDGTGSFGGTNVKYQWRLLTTVDFKWKAYIKKADQIKATAQILPYINGGYNFELQVTDDEGCVSKDTVNITTLWGSFPPQAPNGNGWRRAIASDTVYANTKYGIGFMKINDIIVEANSGTITGGKVDVNLLGVAGLTITPGTKVLIRGGNYRSIRMAPNPGTCVGTSNNPIIITNYDGQVTCQTFTITNFKYTKITGEYVAGVSGHPNFRGHADGNYAFSRGKYGIESNNGFTSIGSAGLRIAGTSTSNLDISFMEICNGNFTAIMTKNDNTGEVWDSCFYHDLYVHDIHGEGIYNGSTSNTDPQNLFQNTKMWNCRFIHSGNDIFQFNQIGTGGDFRNNIFINSASNAKSTFSNSSQENAIQLQARAGNTYFRNNIVLGNGYSIYNVFYGRKAGITVGSDTLHFLNNLHLFAKGFIGGYQASANGAVAGMVVNITGNYYGQFHFRGDEIWTNTSNGKNINTSTVIRTAGGGIPKYYARNNTIDGSDGKTVFMTGTSIDTAGTVTQSITYPQFVNSGWATDFNWDYIEQWCDSIYKRWGDETPSGGVHVGDPVVYNTGDWVICFGKIYRSKINNNHANMPMGVTDNYWELQTWDGHTYPPEDFRLVTGSFYALKGMGLLETGVNRVFYRLRGWRIRKP